MSPGANRKTFPALTGLRGLVILSVIVLHFHDSIVALLPGLEPVARSFARMAFRMDLFFMLSGFIVSHVFIAPDAPLTFGKYLEFLRGRFVRLYPAYLAAFLLLAGLVTFGRWLHLPIKGDYPWAAVPFRLALLQAWPFMQWGTWTWNYPTWFLSALMFGYVVVFPCSWWLVRRLRGSSKAWLWLYGPVALWLVAWRISPTKDFQPLMRVACEFLAGSALYVLYVDRSRFVEYARKHLDKTAVGFLVAAAALSAEIGPLARSSINAALEFATPLLLAGATGEATLTARFLGSRAMRWLGGISYALFLMHAPAQKVLKIILPTERFVDSSALMRWSVAGAYVAVVIGFAVALHRWVEIPCAEALKRRFQKRAEPLEKERLWRDPSGKTVSARCSAPTASGNAGGL